MNKKIVFLWQICQFNHYGWLILLKFYCFLNSNSQELIVGTFSYKAHFRSQISSNAEVEKLLKAGFIYPIALTKWVSNPIPVDKKQGTIHICIDFWYLNKSCPKDNYPMPFIDQIIDACAGSEVFRLWMVSSDIIKSKLNQKINIKQLLFVLGVPSCTRKFPLDWKIQGKPFSRQWIFLFTTLKPLSNPTLMIYQHILIRGSITQITCVWFLNDADTTKFTWIPTSNYRSRQK